MKKVHPKISSQKDHSLKTGAADETYEIIHVNPEDDEIHLKYSKDAKVSAHIARWFLDYEYNQLIWSDGVFDILELDPRNHNASYFTFLEVIHPNDRHIKIAAQESLKKTSKPVEINYRLLLDGGRIKWINEICNTDFDQNRHPVRSYGTIQDITKYKLSEEEFKQRKERFSNLIESIPSGIAIIQNNKLTFINTTGKKLLSGNSETSVIGKNISVFLFPNLDKQFKKTINNVLNGQIEPSFETKLRNLDGSVFDAEITLIYTIYHDSPGVELIMNDITERKKAEHLLKENEARLKEIVATKDKFFSIIAHDLRSPFNSILGFIDLLQNQYNEFTDKERRSYLKLIDENINKTLKLLDNLLDWAKSQTGKISFQPKKQKLLPLIKGITGTLETALSLKFIKLKVTIAEDLEIVADTNMLRTIFQNLISNAIKYSYQEGMITISATIEETFLKVIVSDTGVGMKDEILNKLFRIDEQISLPGTANEKGSGLGLILCKDFIERHNGTISVESEFGRGSAFIILLPQEAIH